MFRHLEALDTELLKAAYREAEGSGPVVLGVLR